MIGAKRVTAPDGTTWRVGRRWLPKKPVLWSRRPSRGDWFFPNIGLGDADGVFAVVLAARLLFRRPWTIRARAGDGRELAWRARRLPAQRPRP